MTKTKKKKFEEDCEVPFKLDWIVDLRIQIKEWKDFILHKLSERKEHHNGK